MIPATIPTTIKMIKIGLTIIPNPPYWLPPRIMLWP